MRLSTFSQMDRQQCKRRLRQQSFFRLLSDKLVLPGLHSPPPLAWTPEYLDDCMGVLGLPQGHDNAISMQLAEVASANGWDLRWTYTDGDWHVHMQPQ
mmetsp:Transcript_47730/g.87744  ORF Transcript_47730/g.87744 Transcript_47730/m.87744 type:complete len:98 (-) Transcript_47730:116-409(-)